MNGTERMNSTFSNQTAEYSKYSLAVSATILSIELVIALVGVLGNIMVCVVITKRANMKTSMNLYLRNLAITDLGVLLVIFPMAAKSAGRSMNDGWVLGRFVCLYIYPGSDIFFGASIWSITVIAIERYKNIISRKVFVKKVESFKRVTLKIVLIWLISFALVAAPLYPLYVYRYIPGYSYYVCFPEWPGFMNNLMFKAYAVCLVIFWYLLPLSIITITYWKISTQLRQSTNFHKTMHGEDTVKSKLFKEEEKRRIKQNKKAQRILTPLVVIFAVTMLPFNVLRTLQAFTDIFHPRIKHFFLIIDLSILCLVINSSIDPIVYYLCSKEFRVGMKRLFFKKGNLKSQDTTIDSHSHSHSHDKATRSLVTAEIATQDVESPM